MIPIRLEFKNFLPYRSPDPIRFDGIHLACLTGPNGAGKSSLLDAITWALWGKARAKRDEELIHQGQSEMYVQLDFEQEGVLYRVLRRRAHAKRAQGELNLFILQEDKPVLQNEPSMRQTQDKINRILRLNYETFVHSAFLQQGKADSFTTQNPADRKRILSDILGLARWARYEEIAKERAKGVARELDVIDLRIHEIDSELSKEKALLAVLDEAEIAYEEAQASLRLAEESLSEVAHAPGELRRCLEQVAGQERRLREHQRDLDTAASEIERHQDRIATYNAVIATRGEIESGYAALKSARDADTTLGEKLRQLSDFDGQYHELERRLDTARAELENDRSAYEARIEELERLLSQNAEEEFQAVQDEISTLQEADTQRAVLETMLRNLGEERARLGEIQRALTSEGRELRDRLDRLKDSQDPLCPLCGQPLSPEHREQLVVQLNQEVEEKREHYRQNHDRLNEITKQHNEYKAAVKHYEDQLKHLQPLLERGGSLQQQIDSANEARLRLDQERAGLEAVVDILEREAYAQDIREQLAALRNQRDALAYDRVSHDTARQQLNAYQEYENRQRQLELALNALPDAQAALAAAQARHERIVKALESDHNEIEKLRGEIGGLELLVEEQQNRQAEVNRQRTHERSLHERLVNARQELKALGQQRQRKAELEERREIKRYEESIFNELRSAFGKNGIPAMIIETTIPELEATANALLARMTDGRMALRITTQREKVTGGLAETLDIEIADELGTRAYELYSGGEAFRINFAIRIALSQMLARRAGAQLRTLFIDEGFGTQDDDGRNKLVEAITAIQDNFAMILVITHIDDLRDSFPVHMVIDKTGSGSRIVVR